MNGLPPCPICGKDDLSIGTDGKPNCRNCEVAVVLPDQSQGRPMTTSRSADIYVDLEKIIQFAERGIEDLHRHEQARFDEYRRLPPPPLDVDRLAEALGRIYDDPNWEGVDPWSREFASMIAAEYERLSVREQ